MSRKPRRRGCGGAENVNTSDISYFSQSQQKTSKVAIYVDDSGDPSHAARQTSSGKWTSKMGELEDIEHDGLSALEGKACGTVARIMKRPRRDQADRTND